MRILKIVSRYRNEFYALFECEQCGQQDRRSGYDDENFHQNVIPKIECSKCGAVAPKVKGEK